MRALRLTALVFLGLSFAACSNPIAPDDACPETEVCGFPTNGN